MREGPLHAAVKALLAEPGDCLEVPVGRFVVDLVRADGEFVEVQTGGFGALGNKLDALLDHHGIRVVHPVAAARRIVRVDEHGQLPLAPLELLRDDNHCLSVLPVEHEVLPPVS
jgi:hypothetical protein